MAQVHSHGKGRSARRARVQPVAASGITMACRFPAPATEPALPARQDGLPARPRRHAPRPERTVAPVAVASAPLRQAAWRSGVAVAVATAMGGCAVLPPAGMAGAVGGAPGTAQLRMEPVLRVQSSPYSPESSYEFGKRALAESRLEVALHWFERALELKPGWADAYNGRAVALSRLDRPQEAAVALRQAIAVQPDQAHLHGNLAVILHRMGQADSAQRELDLAMGLGAVVPEPWRVLQERLAQEREARVAGKPAIGAGSAGTPAAPVVARAAETVTPAAPAVAAKPVAATAAAAPTAVVDLRARVEGTSPARTNGLQWVEHSAHVIELRHAALSGAGPDLSASAVAPARFAVAQTPSASVPPALTNPSVSSSRGAEPIAEPATPAHPFIALVADSAAVTASRPAAAAARPAPASMPAPKTSAPVPTAPASLARTADAAAQNRAGTAVTGLSDVRIEFSNGAGVGGLARRAAAQVAAHGGPAPVRLMNHRNFHQAHTEIQYRTAQDRPHAVALARLMGMGIALAENPGLSAKASIRVVLGRDAVAYADRRQQVLAKAD